MTHATLLKFGYPETLIRDYAYWSVVLRPKQATLGALTLIAKSDETAFSRLPSGAYGELETITRDAEKALHALFSYDRINYLMLMMVDPQAHFHILPRYEKSPVFQGVTFNDPGWPGPPDLGHATAVDKDIFAALHDHIKKAWPA
jgi:diadenosine tetraphosphate (Ap4A) HIT family hydrolase